MYKRQTWTRSPEAHNVPIPTTGTFDPGTPTHLLSSSITPSRQSFDLADEAYGVRRTRRILINHGPDWMAIHDTVASGTLRSTFHLDPSLQLLSRSEGAVILGDDEGFRVTLLRFPGGV